MHVRTRLLAAALAPLAVLTMAVVPPPTAPCHQIRGAATPDTADDVFVCEAQTYFAQKATKVGNLGSVAGVDTVPTWDDTAPGSYQAGNGAGYGMALGRIVATPTNQATFEGKFTGDIETMTINAYMSSPVYENVGGTFPLVFRVVIDGATVINYAPAAADAKDVPLTPHAGCDVPEVGIVCSKMSFTINNLYDAMQTSGVAVGSGVQHTIRVTMAAAYYGDSQSVLLYDAAEVPSGIAFNTVTKQATTKYDAVAGG